MTNGAITFVELAHALFITGLNGGDKTVLGNKDIKRIGE